MYLYNFLQGNSRTSLYIKTCDVSCMILCVIVPPITTTAPQKNSPLRWKSMHKIITSIFFPNIGHPQVLLSPYNFDQETNTLGNFSGSSGRAKEVILQKVEDLHLWNRRRWWSWFAGRKLLTAHTGNPGKTTGKILEENPFNARYLYSIIFHLFLYVVKYIYTVFL